MYPARPTPMVRSQPDRRRRCAPRRLVAALMLAAVAGLAPASARASCAHGVATREDAAMSRAAHLDRLAASGALPDGSWRISTTDRSPARPCSGFGCSRDSRPPATATPASPRIDAWGHLDPSAIAPRAHSSRLPLDGDSPRPIDRADRLARPPRP